MLESWKSALDSRTRSTEPSVLHGFRDVHGADDIRKRRLLLKPAQKTVAGILRVSQFSIINWERGEFQPSNVTTLHRIIKFLGYDPLPAGQTILERLLQQRRLMGWGQRELAEHLGVDRSTISQWELDGTILKRSHRSMVARFLGQSEADPCVKWQIAGIGPMAALIYQITARKHGNRGEAVASGSLH